MYENHMTLLVKKSLKRRCYVIMPFSKHVGIDEKEWNSVYKDIFKPAIEGAGFKYKCERSEISAGAFTKEIVENMKNAHLVLADITGLNGNVMWELGVRHALSTRTIMVAREDTLNESLISDLKIYGVHTYENNGAGISDFKKRIKETLKKIEDNPEKSDNPVFDFLKIEDLILNSFERKNVINKLMALISETIENIRFVEGLGNKEFTIKEDSVTTKRFEDNALLHLLRTNYHNFNEVDLTNLHATKGWIDHLNIELNQLKSSVTKGKPKKDSNEIIKKIKRDRRSIEEAFNIILETVSDEVKKLKQGITNEFEPSVVCFDPKHKKLIEKLLK